MQALPPVTINLALDHRDQVTTDREQTASWDVLTRYLTDHHRRPDKFHREDGFTAFSLARFSPERCTCGDPPAPGHAGCPDHPQNNPTNTPRGHRIARNVLGVTAIGIDFDLSASGGRLTATEAAQVFDTFRARGITAVAYSSHSHAPPDDCHYRVVVAISRELSVDEFNRLRHYVPQYLGIPAGCTSDARHIWFAPSCPPGAMPEAYLFEGVPLDVDQILATVPAAPPKDRESGRIVEPTDAPPTAQQEAALEILAEHWPPVGTRNDARGELAGALAWHGWSEDDISEFLDRLAVRTNDGVLKSEVQAADARWARGSVAGVQAEGRVTGWPTLAKRIGEAVVRDVKRALGYEPVPKSDPDFVAAMNALGAKSKPAGMPSFLAQFASSAPDANASAPPTGTPTLGQITSTLESKRDSYRRASGDGAEQCERRYLGTLLLRVLRAGKDDLFEDAIEFDHAVEAVVSCAPAGTTPEQVATVISAVAGKHRDRAPSVIAEAFQRCGARARQLQAQSQTDAPPSRNVQLAARFVNNHMHPDGPCIRVWRESVYYWKPEGGRYFECDGDLLAQMLYTELGLEDKRAYSDVVHALRGVPGVLVDKNLYDLGSLLPGGSTTFDPRNAIACTNGLLDLTTGVLLPPTPRFFATHVIGTAYDPNAGQPTEWLKFLDSVFPGDPESIACLQEIFGLLLTTDTRYQKIFMFVGLPRSGKGTVLRILRKLLQDNVAAPKTSRLGESFGLESAIGKPVAVISDSRLTGRTDCGPLLETLLSVSGEDAQGVNRKHKQDWTGQMFARFVIATNELLRFDDPSGALAARIVMLRFGETFVGREDTSLTDRLLAELPQILLWAVDGWRNLHARGKFLQASSSQSELEQLADLADPVGAWMRATCEVGTDPKTGERFAVAKNVARSSYAQWCLQQEIVPANAIEFGRKLSAKGYRAGQLSDKARTPTYVGFRIRAPEAAPQEGVTAAPTSPPPISTLN